MRSWGEAQRWVMHWPSQFNTHELRFDAVAEVAKSVPEGTDRVQEYRFRPTGPEHRELFDGPE